MLFRSSNICPPKGLNIPLIREVIIGLLGTDRTNELDDTNSSIFADLMTKAQAIEGLVATIQHKIQGGYRFAGDIEVISAQEAHVFEAELVRLKGICNQLQRYNTKAKMRNIDWTIDMVKKAMNETKTKLYATDTMLKELRSFEEMISYLRTALSNVTDDALRADIISGLDNIKEVIGKDKAAMDAYKAELAVLKERYADAYFDKYLKAHISGIEYNNKERLMRSESKLVCDAIHDAPFINPARYDAWLKKIGRAHV